MVATPKGYQSLRVNNPESPLVTMTIDYPTVIVTMGDLKRMFRQVWDIHEYESDTAVHGVTEDWRTHIQAVEKRQRFFDDCDGFACTMAEWLLINGVARACVYLIFCTTETGQHHLVCGVELDNGELYILDNRYWVINLASEVNYSWICSMRCDEVGTWRVCMATKHFKDSELMCKCGCKQQLMDGSFMELVESLRIRYDRPMVVSSAYRCPSHNNKVSKTGVNGPHTTGVAIDILASGTNAHKLIRIACLLNFKGIGIKQSGEHKNRFIHLDNLNGPIRPWVWSY